MRPGHTGLLYLLPAGSRRLPTLPTCPRGCLLQVQVLSLQPGCESVQEDRSSVMESTIRELGRPPKSHQRKF